MKKHAISAETPKKIMLGAGIFVKGLKWESDKWVYEELGATSGGGKVTYTREFLDPELDGKTVLVKGMNIKVAETAQMEMNMAEYKKDIITSMFGLKEDAAGTATGYKKYSSKASVEETDYVEGVAFIGFTADGKEIIVVFDYAICLSAFEHEGKNKEQGTFAVTIDAVAPAEQEDLTHLPIHFYFPEN